MVTPLSGAKITGVVLFAIGVILIWSSVMLHFVVLPILTTLSPLGDDQQYLLLQFLSGTLGSLLVGGLFALGVIDVIIAIGVIKQKKWAWKALAMLTVACASLNMLAIIGIPNTTSVMVIMGGSILDAGILFYVYKKQIKATPTAEQAKITDKT
jgi:hypothetical protein